MHNVEPLEALRRMAAAAARARRVAERQPHLEREIGAQEVRHVGAVGAHHESGLVLAETQIIEHDIARPIAQHFVQRIPRRRRVERGVEQLLDPGRIQVFVARFHDARKGQTLPGTALGRGGWSARTAMSRVIVPHPAGAWSRARLTRHVPAAGDATSANQEYGGPPCRSRDVAATLPSGAISESSPSSGFSAAKTTRKAAPFHGAIGEDKTASSAASWQAPDAPWAWASATEKRMPKSAPAIGNDAVTAAANWRIRDN